MSLLAADMLSTRIVFAAPDQSHGLRTMQFVGRESAPTPSAALMLT
jgi:hypothetical protein